MMRMLLLKIGRVETPEKYYMLRIPTQNPTPGDQVERIAVALQSYLCEGVTIGMGVGPHIELAQAMERTTLVNTMIQGLWKAKYPVADIEQAEKDNMAGRVKEDIERFRHDAEISADALIAGGYGMPDGAISVCKRCRGDKTLWVDCELALCPMHKSA